MERIAVPRIVISGITPQAGKSLVTIGLLAELRQRGISVSCCVIGSNFKQALLLKGLSERNVHTLDPRIQTAGQMLESLYLASLGAEVVLIEGEDTLIQSDGTGFGFSGGPDTYVSRVIHAPILPIIDGSMQSETSAAALREVQHLIPDIDLLPPIANRMPSSQAGVLERVKVINESLMKFGLPAILGAVPEVVNPEDLPSHGASQKRRALPLSRQYLMDLSSILGKCIDIEEIVRLAKRSPTILLEDYLFKPDNRRCRIAFSLDNAFGLCYQDNLTHLKNAGADIVKFSPLADTHLPRDIGGLYLSGGFLEEYGQDLVRNEPMIRSIQKFHDEGGCIYSEGAGTAYLSREFFVNGSRCHGVGIFRTTVKPGDGKYWHFTSSFLEDNVLGNRETAVSGLANGDWMLSNPEGMLRCLRVKTPDGTTILDGYSPTGQVFGTFSFLHWGTNTDIPRFFVESSSVLKFQP